MAMRREKARIEGIIRISVIDRKTGRVRLEKVIKNTTMINFANLIQGMLQGTWPITGDVSQYYISYIALGKSDKSLIKKLGAPSLQSTSGSGYVGVMATVGDTSGDSYTVYYLAMGNGVKFSGPSETDMTTGSYFAQKLSSPVTKNSTDVLNVSWEVRISYGSV